MAFQVKMALVLCIGVCLHQAHYVDSASEILRSLADHGDRLYDLEKFVNELQLHVLELKRKTDGMSTERDELMVKVQVLEKANPGCCHCCNKTDTSVAPRLTMKPTDPTSTITSSTTRQPTTTTTRSLSTGPPVPRPSPTPCTQSGWTQWFDRDSPEDGIEHEHLDSADLDYYCYKGHVTTISCASSSGVPAYFTHDVFTCELSTGLLCKDSDNTRPCSNYKVRYYCSCVAN